MKITNKIFYVLLTSLFIFSSCDEKVGRDQEQNVSKQDESRIDGTITYERAYKLQRNYIETRAKFLNAYLDSINYFDNNQNKGLAGDGKVNDTIQDVRDVTFDLKTLKKYIAYVERKAKKDGLKGLGLRVYLGAYTKNDTLVKDPGFATVFFMPTHQPEPRSSKANNFFYWNEDEVIEDADGLNLGHGGNPPNDLEEED